MKILMVVTSHDQLGNTGRKTGFWLEEFAAPYFVFRDAGVDVTLASPKGGQPPLDPKSDLPENQTPAMTRFKKDETAEHLGTALKPLVCFLVELYRHRVRVSDPTEVATLLVLHKAGSGLTAAKTRRRLAEADGAKAPSLLDVERALGRLAKAETATKPPEPKPLVRLDGQVWKILV